MNKLKNNNTSAKKHT